MKKQRKGFTLIELLVVIAIIAILSIVVVLTLNPAEMLRRSRDSNRMSDLGVIKTAIALYLADVSTTNMGTPGICYMQPSIPATVYEFTNSQLNTATATAATTCATWFSSNSTAFTVGGGRAVNTGVTSTSWIPINLSLISSGAPIGQWPVDPQPGAGSPAAGNSNAGHFYSFVTTSTNNGYKLAAKMESANYSASGTSDVESTDGGTNVNMFETGSNLSL
jgi:prepilin-type N-terminal cleavage/methylation domain-containing protein